MGVDGNVGDTARVTSRVTQPPAGTVAPGPAASATAGNPQLDAVIAAVKGIDLSQSQIAAAINNQTEGENGIFIGVKGNKASSEEVKELQGILQKAGLLTQN